MVASGGTAAASAVAERAFVAVDPDAADYPAVAGLPARSRCLVMGVLNVTPDSFSDGGRWLDAAAAIRHGVTMAAQGADLVDVGGESTRPGAARVDADEELHRVIPVVRGLTAAGLAVSVDTTRAAVAAAAVDAGAVLVNDVSGGLADAQMLATVAAAGVPYVLMHWRGPSTDMQQRADYGDVVAEVGQALAGRLQAASAAGIDTDRIVLDPGLGFGKSAAHNWQLLGRLDELHELGQPLLVGASRKTFLGALLPASSGEPRPPTGRDDATAAISAIAAAVGVWCVRVHDVPATADAVRVAAAVRANRQAPAERTAGAP